MHDSTLSEFIRQSEVPSNTLLLIPNELGTVFELDVQRWETLEELEIQYSQAFSKPERETNSHNRLLEALTLKATRGYCNCVLQCTPKGPSTLASASLVSKYRKMCSYCHLRSDYQTLKRPLPYIEIDSLQLVTWQINRSVKTVVSPASGTSIVMTVGLLRIVRKII